MHKCIGLQIGKTAVLFEIIHCISNIARFLAVVKSVTPVAVKTSDVIGPKGGDIRPEHQNRTKA